MSERTDQKLREVAIAKYSYRHDAEFAAGFLEDAGIPHRLQLDDPGIGVSLGSMATIWVLAMDVRRARELLEVGDGPVSLSAGRSRSRGPAPTSATRNPAPSRRPTPSARRASRAGGGDLAGTSTSHRGVGTRLGGRARAVALLICGGMLSGGTLFLTEASPPILWTGVAVASAGFAMMGITGRAPGPVSRFLDAIAGNAP